MDLLKELRANVRRENCRFSIEKGKKSQDVLVVVVKKGHREVEVRMSCPKEPNKASLGSILNRLRKLGVK